jgi:hypothetical protein
MQAIIPDHQSSRIHVAAKSFWTLWTMWTQCCVAAGMDWTVEWTPGTPGRLGCRLSLVGEDLNACHCSSCLSHLQVGGLHYLHGWYSGSAYIIGLSSSRRIFAYAPILDAIRVFLAHPVRFRTARAQADAVATSPRIDPLQGAPPLPQSLSSSHG